MSSQGLIFARKRKIEKGSIKYGANEVYIESVELIPFKVHLQVTSENIGLTDLITGAVTAPGVNPN